MIIFIIVVIIVTIGMILFKIKDKKSSLVKSNNFINNKQSTHMEKNNIRPAFFSDQFYQKNKADLAHEINSHLNSATAFGSNNIKAILVPHAGFSYSGQTAAFSYKAIKDKQYNNVILIGDAHQNFFDSIVIDDHLVWETPLGKVAVNKQLTDKLAKSTKIIHLNKTAHDNDHILETQLPFLQTVLKPGFQIVPILIGKVPDYHIELLSELIKSTLKENDLLVISTDLSHYPKYDDANKLDKETLSKITELDIDQLNYYIDNIAEKDIPGNSTVACSQDAIKIIMMIADDLKWEPQILNYSNSGDSESGNKHQVVGYGSIVFVDNNNDEKKSNLTIEQRRLLMKIAKSTVESWTKKEILPKFNIKDKKLKENHSVFVTLRKNENLRGCIGNIYSNKKPLWESVRDMAKKACSDDKRFDPVNENELNDLSYEISVLSPIKKIDNWNKVEIGKHGVIIKKDNKGGIFPPQVATKTGWSREKFLEQLCVQKADLPSDCYKDTNTEILIFTAEVFDEGDLE